MLSPGCSEIQSACQGEAEQHIVGKVPFIPCAEEFVSSIAPWHACLCVTQCLCKLTEMYFYLWVNVYQHQWWVHKPEKKHCRISSAEWEKETEKQWNKEKSGAIALIAALKGTSQMITALEQIHF